MAFVKKAEDIILLAHTHIYMMALTFIGFGDVFTTMYGVMVATALLQFMKIQLMMVQTRDASWDLYL